MRLQVTLLLAAALLNAPRVCAQALAEAPVIGRLYDVEQFGVPRDAKYVFCGEDECPGRTTKTFQPRRVASAPVAHVPSPPPPPVAATASPTRAQAESQTEAPKPKTKRRAVKYECKPVPTK